MAEHGHSTQRDDEANDEANCGSCGTFTVLRCECEYTLSAQLAVNTCFSCGVLYTTLVMMAAASTRPRTSTGAV